MMDKEQVQRKRRELVRQIRQHNPCATLDLIGKATGVTRERVRQILKSEGLSTRGYIQKTVYECLACHKPIEGTGKKFCNKECRSQYHQIEAVCDWCGELRKIAPEGFARLRRGKHIFCSRTCFGKWAAHHYGIGTANNPIFKTVFPHPPRKYNYGNVYRLDKIGWRQCDISRFLRIPDSSVRRILHLKRSANKDSLGAACVAYKESVNL